MPFLLVTPDDGDRVAQAADLLNSANRLDDPPNVEVLPVLLARDLRYGWDLDPGEMYVFCPDGSGSPVGVLQLDFPRRDNRHLAWAGITVHPEHRRRGHGTTMLQEAIRRTTDAGRTTIWLGSAEDDLGARAFIEKFGFHPASHDARRRQALADVDANEVERRYVDARRAAADYVIERRLAPTPDDVLEQLVEVTAAINDAPMGELTFEDEVFDLQRLRDFETAAAGRQSNLYRIWARHRATSQIAGHTVLVTNPLQPQLGWQADTAVSRDHRGHRLGLLLKVEMMRWLAEVEPRLEVIETWNHVDNRYMIEVNEALGYRLSRVFATFELTLPQQPPVEVDGVRSETPRELSEVSR